MKGKTILITAGCVLGFGGIIANTTVGIVEAKKLENDIATLRSDAQQADEDYRKATVDQLTALVENTRNNLKAAYEAADASLQAGLNNAIAAIDEAVEDIAADVDAKDAAYAKSAADSLKALADATQDALDLLGEDIENLEEFRSQAASILGSVTNTLSELDGRLGDVEDELEEAAQMIDIIVDYVLYLEATLNTVASNLNVVANDLATNYYTADAVDQLLGDVDDTLADIISLFSVEDGLTSGIISMQDIVDALNDQFDEYNDRFEDIEDHLEEIDEKLLDNGEGWQDFNGEETTAAKAAAIEQLFTILTSSAQEIQDVYDDICDAYGHQTRSVPASVETLYTTLHTAALEAAANNVNLYTTIAKIILAPTKEAALAVLDSVVGDVEGDINALRFELDKIEASNEVYDLIDTTDVYDFDNTVFEYFDTKIMAMEYDLTGVAEEDKAAYYPGLQADAEFIVDQAEGYADLVDAMNDASAELKALYNTVAVSRLTTPEMIEPFEGDIADLADWTAYKNAIEAVDTTTEELVLDDATAINAFVDSIIDDSEVIVFAATFYDSLLRTQKEMNERIDATGYRTAIGDADVETALAAVAAEIAEASYHTAVEVAREATDEETFEPFTVEQKTQMIMDYIESACVDMEYEALCIELVYNVATKATAADATIEAYTNLSAAEISVLKDQYDDVENKPDLAEVYTASGKDTEDYYGLDEDMEGLFEDLEKSYTGYIDNVLKIAENQNAMNKNTVDSLTALETLAADPTTLPVVADAVNEYKEAVIAISANFNYVDVTVGEEKIIGLDADGATMESVATQSTADLATLKADQEKVTKAYKEYSDLIVDMKNFNNDLESGIDGVVSMFSVGYDNAAGDGEAVANEYGANQMVEIMNNYKRAFDGTATDTVAPFAWIAEADYDTNMAAVDTFRTAVSEAKAQLDLDKVAFQNELTETREEMIVEFQTREATRLENELVKYLGADKDGAAGDLRVLYSKVLELIGDDVAFQNKAGMYLDSAIVEIQKAERSDVPANGYNKSAINFAKLLNDFYGSDVFDLTSTTLAADILAYDPTL